jgi:hypothetical protein
MVAIFGFAILNNFNDITDSLQVCVCERERERERERKRETVLYSGCGGGGLFVFNDTIEGEN